MPRFFMNASPPYPHRHSGTCIVAGFAECLHADLEKAIALVGDVPIIALNAASGAVKALMLFSQHPECFKSKRWIEKQQQFGNDFTVHARGEGTLPYVDYWWPTKGGGGSAWHARKVAALIGFDRVVLCGCPLEVGPYVGGHNIGGLMHRQDVVDDLFEQVRDDTQWHAGAYSMSGRTRDLLGEPC